MTTRTTTQVESPTEEDFVTEREIAERWNVPWSVACVAIAAFEMDPRFPPKDKLMGNRRYWPAVRAFMRARYNMGEKPLPPDGKDHFERRR